MEPKLTEEEIISSLDIALGSGEIEAYFQPQYDHSTGLLVGAEALARWRHPVKGMISPGEFIPVLERCGKIYELDLKIFEDACRIIKKAVENRFPTVPISTNIARHDLFMPDFIEKLEEIRKKHDVPVKNLRLEITESAAIGGVEAVNAIIEKLHACGYIIEMDDFGSGYSSLNLLKDIEIDVVKLDMEFVRSGLKGNSRGGTILTSVVNMMKWLDIPVIAEGVETADQANFLKSVGCNYIQGFLYSGAIPKEDFLRLLSTSHTSVLNTNLDLNMNIKPEKFWDPNSLETLIFSSYVGGAAILKLHDGIIEVLRINEKYARELGMNMADKDILKRDFLEQLSPEDKEIMMKTLREVIRSGEEKECETKRNIRSSCCGEETIFIRSYIQLIGKSDDEYVFYVTIRNITAEKNRFTELSKYERQFKQVIEQVNIYYWEYDVATKDMRPCFRCMRDLGLPAVVHNYPEPAIADGIFPQDFADMYRDWHKQIAAGVKELEAVIPLTVGRVPFRVKYTTDFDEYGRPVKAYGSATLVVD